VFEAFGSYNDLVRQASAVRGQKVVTWDFEYALFIYFAYTACERRALAREILSALQLLRVKQHTTQPLVRTHGPS
jgi:hypothetical protein